MPVIVRLSNKNGPIYPKTVSNAVYDITHSKLLSDYLAELGNPGISYFDDIQEDLPSNLTPPNPVEDPILVDSKIVYVKSQHRFYQIKEMKETQESEESYIIASSVFPGSPSFNDETTSLAKEKTVFIKDNTEPYIFEPQVGLKSLSCSGEGDSGLVWK